MKLLDGEMSITQNLFNTIVKLFPAVRYEKLLEIGSGIGTAHWVAAGYDVTAIEHDIEWVNSCGGAVYHHAPLQGAYYDTNIIRPLLSHNHDIWIIDGPPGILSDRTEIIKILEDKHNPHGITFPRVVVVDDCQREDGLVIASYFFKIFHNCPMFEINNTWVGGSVHTARILLL